jgi:hypothetical protein
VGWCIQPKKAKAATIAKTSTTTTGTFFNKMKHVIFGAIFGLIFTIIPSDKAAMFYLGTIFGILGVWLYNILSDDKKS